MTTLPDFRLETQFSRWEFKARHHMTASDAETMTMSELLALAGPEDLEAWDRIAFGYTETWGAPALRETIASTYDTLSGADILTFAGAEEGLYCAMLALLAPGDHAIVTVPNYQSMETLPLAVTGNVTGVALRPENRWQLDLDDVRAALRPETKLIAVNFPNNPKRLRICGLSSDPIAGELRRLEGRMVATARVEVAIVANASGMGSSCDVVYLENDSPRATGGPARGQILIGAGRNFAEDGGTIGLINFGGQVRFVINAGAARRAGVNISAQLMQLAAKVVS